MNENNKVITLDLSANTIGTGRGTALSTALMNENNKVTTLDLYENNIGTQGLVALLKSLRISLVNDLEIGYQRGLHHKVKTMLGQSGQSF